MATPPQLVQMAFAAGLDESQQGEVLDPMAGFPVLQNVRQDKRGGLTKRLGFASLGKTRLDATTRSAGNRLVCHDETICTIDGTYLDAYAATPGASVVSSRVPEASVTTHMLSMASATSYTATFLGGFVPSVYDIVYVGGYVVTLLARNASATTIDLLASVETLDGSVLRSLDEITSGAIPFGRLAVYGNYVILLTATSSSGNIAASYLDTTSAATISTGWVSIGNIATDKNTAGTFPRMQLGTQSLTDRIAFAYVNNSGGASQVTVKTMTIAGVTQTATINTSSNTPDNIAIQGSTSDTLWVAWNETTSVKLTGLNASSLSTVLATTATIITATTSPSAGVFVVAGSTAGTGAMFVHDGNSLYSQIRKFQTTAGAAATSGGQETVFGLRMTAQPIQVGGRYYGLFREGDDDTSVVCDWTDMNGSTTTWARPIAMAFPNLTPVSSVGLHPISISSTRFGYAQPVTRSAAGDGIALVLCDLADRKRWRAVSHNGSLYLAGGVLSYFDGRRVSEAAFLFAPQQPSAVDSGVGSGPNGTYKYVTTFEEIDDDGNWCISGVSLPSETLSIVNNEATVTVYPLVASNRFKPSTGAVDKRVRQAIYRTLTGAEPPYYFVGSVDNNTAAPSTFTDGTTDTDLATRRLLYGTGNLPGTNGAGQDRRAPPYCQDIASYNGMLVVASGSDLWWSGQTVGGEGLWWSPAFVVPVEGDGAITALAAQDGTLYVFKRRCIFAVSGEAPSDNGTVGGLGTPRRLAVDTGCIDLNSIVVTSLGIFFQSERGIELLTRSGAVSWIGQAVQDTLASYPVVSSAVLDSRNGLVRISLAAAESGGRVSGNGRDVVFDLALGAWQSVDDKTGASAHEASQDAAMLYVSGSWRYGWLGTDGTVYHERLSSDGSAYLDGSTWVTMAAETAWLKLGGIQGHHHMNKVLLLARKSSRADLNTYLSYDYATTTKTVMTRVANDIDSLSSAIDRIQVEHQMHDEAEGQGIKVKFEDATPTGGTVGNGKGATWIALTFEGVPRQGAVRVPEAGM